MQEDCCESEVSLIYTMSNMPSGDAQHDPVSERYSNK